MPDKTIMEHITDDVIWKFFGSILMMLLAVGAWFAKRDRNRMDEDAKATKLEQQMMWSRLNETDHDLRSFKEHVAQTYVTHNALDTHIVERLQRIETKLDKHIEIQATKP